MRSSLLVLLAWFTLTVSASAPEMVRRLHVRVPMRDGVQLAANIFLPTEAGRFPILLVRTPYS